MRVLVTGGFGHIGSHVLAELGRRGRQVRVLTPSLPTTRKAAARHPGVEVVWGATSDPAAVARAVAGVDAIVHLAAILPPLADERPELARLTNVDGTATVIAVAAGQPTPPRLIFSSSFDVHGLSQTPPPRKVDDPLVPTNPYAAQKIEAEGLVRASGLPWCILRLADVPILGARNPPAIMFEISPDNRIETVHVDDVALAMVNAVESDAVWGRVFFIGGGPSCQLTYRDYVTRMLAAMGIGALPDSAFREGAHYPTDWLDTTDSEALLHYQRHTFDDITAAVAKGSGWKRYAARAFAPIVRQGLLRLSPHYRASRSRPPIAAS
jgi:UDP-glucose 4-epimerase